MFSQSLSFRHMQLCSLCDEDINDHASGCPCRLAEEYARRRISARCGECRGTVEINSDDFYECKKCHVQFSASELGNGDLKEKRVLLVNVWREGSLEEDAVTVVKMPELGRARFPVDEALRIIGKFIQIGRRTKNRGRKVNYQSLTQKAIQEILACRNGGGLV